jgi:hypothetical protein
MPGLGSRSRPLRTSSSCSRSSLRSPRLAKARARECGGERRSWRAFPVQSVRSHSTVGFASLRKSRASPALSTVRLAISIMAPPAVR